MRALLVAVLLTVPSYANTGVWQETATTNQSPPQPLPPRAAALPINPNAKALYAAMGSRGGLMPLVPRPDFDSYFAMVAVEITSSAETVNLAVTGFELIDIDQRTTGMKRVVEVLEVIDRTRPKLPDEHEAHYYLWQPGITRPWNGTLPIGTIRLRIRVALIEEPVAPGGQLNFRLTLGPHVIWGPVSIRWPS